MIGNKLTKKFNKVDDMTQFIDSDNVPNNSGCKLGDYSIDSKNKYLYVCLNTKQRDSKFQQIDFNSQKCQESCNVQQQCVKESFQRNLSENDPTKKQEQYVNVGTAKPVRKAPGESDWKIGEPQDGDDVLIPCEWTVLLNKPNFIVNNLIIDGTLVIDESIQHTQITARNIWVRNGKLIAGNIDVSKRYTKQLTITLSGEKEGEALKIDDFSNPGTKSLIVTGKLEIYGTYPKNTKARLAKSANVGDKKIELTDDIQSWALGDEIVFGSSETSGKGYEKRIISAVDSVLKTISFNEGLSYWHYGSSKPTIGQSNDHEVKIDSKFNDFGLDMRCSVGHISRNVKIIGKSGENLGGHLQVYHYMRDNPNINARGSVVLEGVELINMGQSNSERAGLHFLNTNKLGKDYAQSIIKGSSIHDCEGICVSGINSSYVSLTNNIIYNGQNFLIQALDSKIWDINNNLLIGASKNPSKSQSSEQWDAVAIINMWSKYSVSTEGHRVSNNIGSGSEGIGYAFPATECQEKDDNGFKNNEISNCAMTGVIFNMDEDKCYSVGYISAYHNKDGVILNSKYTKEGYIASHFILAENQNNMKLRSGSEETIHQIQLSNTFISAMARQSCTDCYSAQKIQTNSICQNQAGIQLLVTTKTGNSYPTAKSPLIFDEITNETSAFSSCFINDVNFHNFRNQYDISQYPNASQCNKNNALITHKQASDATAGTYLSQVKCQNCEKEGFIQMTDPQQNWRGPLGGCGEFDCTGLKNVIVQDRTGDLLGKQGTIISNNQNVVDGLKSSCKLVSEWNGYECSTIDLGILEWDSMGVDKKNMIPIPVYVANSAFNNTINMWREREFIGSEPQNKRLNRFVSYIINGQEHDIHYTSSQSIDMLYKLQHKTLQGENDKFIIVKQYFYNRLLIEVSNGGVQIPSFVFSENLQTHTTNCGANSYLFDKQSITFVITNNPNCQVRIKQINYVEFKLKIQAKKEDLVKDKAKQNEIISKFSQFLSIDNKQIQIVGFQGDQSLLQVAIKGEAPYETNKGYKPQEQYDNLKQLGIKLQKGLQEKAIEISYKILDSEFKVHVIKNSGLLGEDQDFITEQSTDQGSNPNNGNENKALVKKNKKTNNKVLEITLAVVFTFIGLVSILLIFIFLIKRKQKQESQILPNTIQTEQGLETFDNIIKINTLNTMSEEQLK